MVRVHGEGLVGYFQLLLAEQCSLSSFRWDRNNRSHIFPMTTDTGFCRIPIGPQVEARIWSEKIQI